MGIAIKNVTGLPAGVNFINEEKSVSSRWSEDFYGYRIIRSRSFSVKALGLESAMKLAIAQREYMAALHSMQVRTTMYTEPKPNPISAQLPDGIINSGDMIVALYTENYKGVNIRLTKAFSINRFGYTAAVRLAKEWRKAHHQPNATRIKTIPQSNEKLPVGVTYYKTKCNVWTYQVSWQETGPDGMRRRKYKSFSTDVYGKEEAKRMAITHRKAMLAINGHR